MSCGRSAWPSSSAFKLRITLDDGTVVKSWATEARIANGSFHGGVELVEQAGLDSGEMVIQAVTGKSVLGSMDWFATLFKLRHREADGDRMARAPDDA